MERVKLVYVGKCILTGNKIGHEYQNPETLGKYFNGTSNFIFKKKLLGYEIIGTVVEAERTATGVKTPYTILKDVEVPKEKITEWSVRSAAVEQKIAETKEVKLVKDSSLEALIKAVKDNTVSSTERRRVVQYIISKLL